MLPRPAFVHLLDGALRAEELPLDVEVEHLVVDRLGGVRDRLRAGDAGVVDEDVEPAERGDGLLDDADALGGGAEVAVDGDGGAAGSGDLGDGRLGALAAAGIVEGDLRALAREGPGDALPDTHAGAGDQRGASAEIRHVVLPPGWMRSIVRGSLCGKRAGRKGAVLVAGRRAQVPTLQGRFPVNWRIVRLRSHAAVRFARGCFEPPVATRPPAAQHDGCVVVRDETGCQARVVTVSSMGVRTKTGISRSVFCWYSA